MDDYIIRISNDDHFRTTVWRMTIDLRALSDLAGKRMEDKYNGGTFVDVPIPRAKKLLKLIREYGTQEDFQKVDRNLKNKRLLSYWKTIRKCCGNCKYLVFDQVENQYTPYFCGNNTGGGPGWLNIVDPDDNVCDAWEV